MGRPQLMGFDARRYGRALSSTFLALGNLSMLDHVRSMTTSPLCANLMSAGERARSEKGERTMEPWGMAPSDLTSFPRPNFIIRFAVHFLGSHWHSS